jgi:uncharacterized protein
MISGNYVLDALYGPIRFPDYVWEIAFCPEIQRLREVRLSNINSLRFTGGANVNRYEHSLGVAYLAQLCTQKMWFGVDERLIILAALLHDVGTAPFGHSVQYALENQGYKHESLYNILTGECSPQQSEYPYRHIPTEQIYLGERLRVREILSKDELKQIDQLVSGHGTLGPLISGSLDLDNLDNVYRLSYHMGLVRSGNSPLSLAQVLYIEDGKLLVPQNALPLIEEWGQLRRRLYGFLLLDQAEFSAKCMLQDALEQASKDTETSLIWRDVDFELVNKLLCGPDEVARIASRLMLGNLYGCAGVFSTSVTHIHRQLLKDPSERHSLEGILSDYVRSFGSSHYKNALVGLHTIEDVGRSQRQVQVQTDDGKTHLIGTSSNRVLIGVFFKNVNLSLARGGSEKTSDSLKDAISRKLSEVLGLDDIEEIVYEVEPPIPS